MCMYVLPEKTEMEAGRGLSVYVGGIIISCLYTIRALMTLT